MGAKHIPNTQRRKESDAKIISAAIKNFGLYGYAQASISKIAKDAGVSPGLITNRYASKEELFAVTSVGVLEKIAIDYDSVMDAREFLIQVISVVIKLYKSDYEMFKFVSTLYMNYDKPKNSMFKLKEAFESTKGYVLLNQAQKDGLLQKGDISKLMNAFLAHIFIQLDICKRFGVDMPENDYFLAAIYKEDKEFVSFYYQQFLNVLMKEYQSAWLIKVDDLSLNIFTYDEKKAAANSVQTVLNMQNYEEARLWYIENCVVEQSRKLMLEQTTVDYILAKIAGGKPFFVEYGRCVDGEINYNQLCYNKIVDRNDNIEYISMGFRNIDIAKRSEIDDLTGVYTRQVFFKKAEEILQANPDIQFDICISDIVDFKKINEIYGVEMADKILRWEGKYLLALQDDMTIVGRYGSDQMVMLGTHEFIHSCTESEQRNAFASAKEENGLPEIRIKFGICEDIRKNRSVVGSCDNAHTALNSIKHHYGEDIAFYNNDIKVKIEKQRRIEDSMYKSLRNGDFKVYYQPKHNAKTGELVGAEALVRWIHPEYGFMSPGDFIPLFETNGFIVENDRFVWRKTCENLKDWGAKGIKTVPISINASRLTMANADVVRNMQEAVRNNALSAEQLHIEITETLMTENMEDLLEKLNEIREIGFKVELDDFGSGYSSINILSSLPIDILKLDMSFMQQFGDEKRAKVLAACINLAKELGFKTVSEGVEYKEQNELLDTLGVDMIQGYLYSKPLPEDEFEKYMIEHLK